MSVPLKPDEIAEARSGLAIDRLVSGAHRGLMPRLHAGDATHAPLLIDSYGSTASIYAPPATASVAGALSSANYTLLVHLAGLLDGTGSGNVIIPAGLYFNNDANAALGFSGSNPILQMDSGPDAFAFIRATNTFQFFIGGSVVSLQIDGATGKLTGAGIYRSAEVGIANGATANFTHGLGARPSWVGGFYNTVSGTEDSLTNPMNVGVGSTGVALSAGSVTSTIVTVSNNSGAGIAARVYAML